MAAVHDEELAQDPPSACFVRFRDVVPDVPAPTDEPPPDSDDPGPVADQEPH